MINDLGQGLLGNCYFLASIGSIAYKKPKIIKNMIEEEKDFLMNVIIWDTFEKLFLGKYKEHSYINKRYIKYKTK